ncbi:uncharacterized protein P884DRAFT_256270 [Thermothelomyces heterothallicus CBS 202.75]|uniref:uncharacterized protein n=1 Tax=Thermothelomyces heterothallicus CBS 202.75 TaxID=1149848 RepID=UPI003743F220
MLPRPAPRTTAKARLNPSRCLAAPGPTAASESGAFVRTGESTELLRSLTVHCVHYSIPLSTSDGVRL